MKWNYSMLWCCSKKVLNGPTFDITCKLFTIIWLYSCSQHTNYPAVRFLSWCSRVLDDEMGLRVLLQYFWNRLWIAWSRWVPWSHAVSQQAFRHTRTSSWGTVLAAGCEHRCCIQGACSLYSPVFNDLSSSSPNEWGLCRQASVLFDSQQLARNGVFGLLMLHS